MLLIDSPLGHYQLLHQIGSGGTGTMYLAQDSRTSRQVALIDWDSRLALGRKMAGVGTAVVNCGL